MQRASFVFATSLIVLVLASCSESYSPTAPPPTSTTPPTGPVGSSGSFVGNIMDVDTHRACIPNAWAESLSSGVVYRQNFESCEDSSIGFVINNLSVGSVLRLRLSAPGYISVERDFLISQGGGSVDINLKRAE